MSADKLGLKLPPRQELLQRRQELIQGYLGQLTGTDATNSELVADQLMDGGAKPLADTVAIAPINSIQEALNIEPAICQYGRMNRSKPFSIVLGLNQYSGLESTAGAVASRAAVGRAIDAHPDLDIRVVDMSYSRPVIGRIRRDLWNGTMRAADSTGNFDGGKEMVGINHDIDTVQIAKSYMERVQAFYGRLDRVMPHMVSPVRGSQSRHAASREHPVISRTVAWSDYVYRKTDVAYEAGLIVPMSYYAWAGGINGNAHMTEVVSLLDATPGDHSDHPPLIDGTSYATSLRRYVAYIGERGYNVWSEGSFGAFDECRTRTDYPDISVRGQHRIMAGSFDDFSMLLVDQAIKQASPTSSAVRLAAEAGSPGTLDRVMQSVEHTKRRSAGVLGRLSGSRVLVGEFVDRFDAEVAARF